MPGGPLRALVGHDVAYLQCKDVVLNLGPLGRLGWEGGVEGVEDGGVVVVRLQEPAQEIGPVVARLLLHQGHDVRGLVWYHAEQGPQRVHRDALEPVSRVDGKSLPDSPVEHTGPQVLQLLSDWVKLKWDVQRVSQLCQAPARLPYRVKAWPNTCDAEEWSATWPRGQGLHEGWPLVALDDVEVNDVDPLLKLDGLVRGEVGKLYVRASLVKDLVDHEDLWGVRWDGGEGLWLWGGGGGAATGGGGRPGG